MYDIVVEIDLRPPSMLHGKKGFERILWAARNVLNHSLMWLFCDLHAKNSQLSDAGRSLDSRRVNVLS